LKDLHWLLLMSKSEIRNHKSQIQTPMEGEKFKRTLGGVFAAIGLLLLLFACFAFMSSTGKVLGINVEGAVKIAPTILGLILMVMGVSMINRT
jgi:small neutral amino acid transporter SnatA (MarC family)